MSFDWSHLFVTAAGYVAVIATMKTDITWIKRWLRNHEESDSKRFDKLEDRLNNL